jgi:processive 1,2-diacylglycerol beta-glucosyltransferase
MHASDRAGDGARVLVLCAAIGEGHLTVARRLVADLEARADIGEVALRSDLEVMGERFGEFMTRGFQIHLEESRWTYELAYRLFHQRSLPRRAAQRTLAVLGGRGLRRTLGAWRPDVVVTEYPVLSAALGVLRADGRIDVPVCSSVSDPAGLYYWAHPGIDLHLLSWPEALGEVDRIAGPRRAAAVKPLIDSRFLRPPSREVARADLELPSEAPVLVISGGGWGLGDLEGAAWTALEYDPKARAICLAGRNEAVRSRLQHALGAQPRVRILGFTERMPELLAAADAIVHTTGGTTALEARAVRCPLINYGRGIAHVRAHARALRDMGLAEWAPERAALNPAIARALTRARRPPVNVEALPDAAALVATVAARGGYGAGSSGASSPNKTPS